MAEHQKNPIDVATVRITAPLLPLFHATGHTPNLLTTYSMLAGLGAVAALWRGNAAAFAAAYSASYAFDCMDGAFARRYGMVSAFGDAYDHGSDALVTVLLLVVLFWRHGHRVGFADAAAMGALAALMLVHLGCEQAAGHSPVGDAATGSLDQLRRLCPGPGAMRWTRLFGCGTVALAIVLYGTCLLRKSERP